MERSNTTEERQTKKMSVYFQPKSKSEKEKNEEAGKAVARVFGFFISPAILMLVWNWLIPGLFGFATLTYLQALVLCWLIKLLFDYTHELK